MNVVEEVFTADRADCADGTEAKEIAIYADGSGKASEYLERAIKELDQRAEHVKLVRAFIEKHQGTLAGLYWKPGWGGGASLEISPGMYRGKPADGRAIARLWPHAIWGWRDHQYGDDGDRDYVAEIDGVQVVIELAERGGRVKERHGKRSGHLNIFAEGRR